MRHADLQYRGCSVCAYGCSHVRATHLVVIERSIKRQRPSVLQVSQHVGQAFEPCHTLLGLVAASREPTWDSKFHAFHCSRFTSGVIGISEMWPAPRGALWADERATRSATCKAAEDDCLERRNSIRPCVPSHVAYKAERGGNELFWSPWKMYPRSQERHRNREATVYLPA